MPDRDPLIDSLLAQVEVGAGRAMNDQERERLKKVLTERVGQANTLRQVELSNGDEPFTVFRAFRETR